VTISPELYEETADMSTIDMPETQEEDYSNKDEDKAPSDDGSVLLTQFLGSQMWTTQFWMQMGQLIHWVGSFKARMAGGCQKMMIGT
jgi:hypothetical protein